MKNKTYALLALAISLSTSCSREEIDNNLSGQTITFASGVNKYDTRINESGDQWLKDDEVGIYMLPETGDTPLKSNIKYTTVSAGTSTTFQTTDAMYYPTDGSSVNFMAYHPYSASVSTEYPINLASQANQTSLDLMYARSTQSYNQSLGTAVSLTFNHVLTKVILNITADETVGDISEAQVTVKGMNTTAKFNLSAKAIENEGDAGDIKAYKSATANRYEFILLPVAELTDAHTVEFEVNGSTYTWTISKNDGNITQFKAGYKYTFKINLTDTGVDSEVESEQGGSVNPWNPEEGNGTANPDPDTEPTDPTDPTPGDAVTTTEELLAAIEAAADGGTVYLNAGSKFYINAENTVTRATSLTVSSIDIQKSITLEGTSATELARINAKLIAIKGSNINFTIKNIEFSGFTVNSETGVPTEDVVSGSYFLDINGGTVNNLTIDNCFIYGIANGIVRANRASDSLNGNVTITNNRCYNIGGNNGGLITAHASAAKGGTWTIQNNTVAGIGQGFYGTTADKKVIVVPKAAVGLTATISNNTFFGIASTNNFIDSGDGSSSAGTFLIEKNIVIFTAATKGPRLGLGTVSIKDNAVYPALWTGIGKTYTESNTVAITANPFTGVEVTGLISLNANFTPDATLKANGWGDSRWLK
ncbi:fimbrillin family protein [Bacteroides sp. 224]|uniref:fimbrillin family protein n=1 Tax=Bacteroides sp. 224 TaxID=2302936 RepID=UPI0013D24B19|nr:fimbrillin family protein [Bacteroides sp. 224]NDV63683.1 DUF4957 domain-containing protein [Bacteroides sp. 224]